MTIGKLIKELKPTLIKESKMSVGNRIQATLKNLEGRLEEAVGALTGNRRLKSEGQVKQAQATAEHTKENLKDRAKRWIDRT